MLDHLEDGIQEFKATNRRYVRGVCYSNRCSWKLISHIIYLLISAIRVANILFNELNIVTQVFYMSKTYLL